MRAPHTIYDVREVPDLNVSADHDKLITMGQRRFNGFTPYQVVTFLNQVLKEQGFIFGLRQFDADYELTVYDIHDVSNEA